MSVLGCREHNLLRIRCATFEHMWHWSFACYMHVCLLCCQWSIAVKPNPSGSGFLQVTIRKHSAPWHWLLGGAVFGIYDENTQQLCAQWLHSIPV